MFDSFWMSLVFESTSVSAKADRRRMEKYCREQEGTFCFSRPIYTDTTNVPPLASVRSTEAGRGLWVEGFDN